MAHHILVARQGGNAGGNGGGNGFRQPPLIPSPSSATAATLSSSTPTSTSSDSPSLSPSEPKHTSISSSAQSTTSTPPVVETTTTSSSISTSAPTSIASSTTTSSSTTSSSISSTSSVHKQTTTSTPTLATPIVNTNLFTPTTSFTDGTPTDVNGPGATISASALNTSTSSDLSAGSIVGAVVGTLIGLAVIGFLVAFVLRRYRRSRRRALHDSDFGTFRRSMFVSSRSSAATPTLPNMTESQHNVAPSLNEPYVPYPAVTVQPPSQALAAATTAGGVLQERPKYVYGQDPIPANQQRQHDDSASDTAHGGAYSSQPQAQGAYNTEAYGSYVKYEDVDNGIVGGVPTGSTVYQDAQRAYQGQQGYDQSHYATYDQSQYEGYDQQHAAYSYPEQQQHYEAGAHANAYGGM